MRNVIIQYAVHQSLQNKHGHIDVRLTGKERRNTFWEETFTGSWHKKDLNSPTVFLDEEGKAIQPVQGKTWIQVVRKEKNLYWNKKNGPVWAPRRSSEYDSLRNLGHPFGSKTG